MGEPDWRPSRLQGNWHQSKTAAYFFHLALTKHRFETPHAREPHTKVALSLDEQHPQSFGHYLTHRHRKLGQMGLPCWVGDTECTFDESKKRSGQTKSRYLC
jgi:hypothetical protein